MLSSVSFFIFWDVCVKWTENIKKDSQILLAKMEVTPAKEVCFPVLVTVLLECNEYLQPSLKTCPLFVPAFQPLVLEIFSKLMEL